MTEGLKSTILSVRLYQIFNPLALRALPLSHLRWAEGEGKSVTLNGHFVLWVFFLFPLSCSIKPHGNNRWERFKSGIFCCIRIDFTLLPCFFTPSPYGHSPYLICDEQRERVKASLWTAFLFCEDFSYISLGTSWERVDTLIRFLCCGYFLTPPSLRATSSIFCVAKRRGGV